MPVNSVSVDPFPFSLFFSSIDTVHGLMNSISLRWHVDGGSENLHFKYLCETCKSGYPSAV